MPDTLSSETFEQVGSYKVIRENGRVWVWENGAWLPLYAIIRSALSGMGNGPTYSNRANGYIHPSYNEKWG